MEQTIKILLPLDATLNEIGLQIPRLKESGVSRLYLDMSEIKFMDSLDIGILVRVALTARNAGLKFFVYKMQSDVRRALTMSGAGELLGIRDDKPPSFETEVM